MIYEEPKTFDISVKRPAVLLIGNGVNRIGGRNGLSWANAVFRLAKDDAVIDKINRLNFSIRATVTADTEDSKRWLRYKKLFDDEYIYNESPELLRNLLSIPFDAVLTTNYTYELEQALDKGYTSNNDKEQFARCTISDEIQNDVTTRLLHTYNQIDGKNIWHIHGEARDPRSIILTHDEYSRLVYEMVGYDRTHVNAPVRFESWIDYFVYGDLYIIGYGFNFAEFDLWWLLNCRRNRTNGAGKLIFFTPKTPKYPESRMDDPQAVCEALEQINVRINHCGAEQTINMTEAELMKMYDDFYRKAAGKIKKWVETPRSADTELMIEYRDKFLENHSKVNFLRALDQLTRTEVYLPLLTSAGFSGRGNSGNTPKVKGYIPLFTSEDEIPASISAKSTLEKMTGLDAFRLLHLLGETAMIVLDPFSLPEEDALSQGTANEKFLIDKLSWEHIVTMPEELEKAVKAANERDLARRRINVNKASEESHHVRAYISHNSFPMDLNKLDRYRYRFSFEYVFYDVEVQWTSPDESKIGEGDIVFFWKTDSSIYHIKKLEHDLQKNWNSLGKKKRQELKNALIRGRNYYDKIGGKIYAIGQVCGSPEVNDDHDFFYEPSIVHYWKGKEYCSITNLIILDNPVSMDDFTEFITLRFKSSYTLVVGRKFDQLKELIIQKNPEQYFYEYFKKSTSIPEGFSWLQISSEERKGYDSEYYLRGNYVDYLLEAISSHGKIWANCRGKTPDGQDVVLKNMIQFCGRYLPIDVSLKTVKGPVTSAKRAQASMSKSVSLNKNITIESGQMYEGYMLVIDKNSVYIYDAKSDHWELLIQLDELHTDEDVQQLRQKIANYIGADL